jgi:hypothetical protein
LNNSNFFRFLGGQSVIHNAEGDRKSLGEGNEVMKFLIYVIFSYSCHKINRSMLLQITKALPGRTDNAIKNRFNAACRNHALLMASNAAAGVPPRDITLYEALHMHDAKSPSNDKQGLPSKNPYENGADQLHVMQQDAYYTSSGNTAFYSPLGPRSFSPSGFNESSKYQRVDMTPQQIQQQHFLQYQQQQQQLYQQQQEQQLHLAQMQQHQLQQHQMQLQHQMQQQQLHQLSNRSRSFSIQTPSSNPTQIPRPLSLNSTIQHISTFDFRHVNVREDTDMDMAITPELFDRIALSSIPMPVALAHHTTVKVNAVQALEYSDAPSSADSSRSVHSQPQFNSQNGGNNTFQNIYNNTSISPNNTGAGIAAGSNNNNNNNNNNNGYSLNSSSGSFIDFDESIFEDWVSDDTEMDFIDATVPSKPTVYDFLSSGCAPSQGFCSGGAAAGSGQFSQQDGAYAQNTNAMCCGFPTAYAGDQEPQSRQTVVGQQMIHGQMQPPHQVPLTKSKPSVFGSSIRALGNRICGPGQVDSSYQHQDTVYDAKVYSSSQVMIKQDGCRPPTGMGAGLTSSYGQTALREQYAASRSKLDNRNGMGPGGAYPTQGFHQDGNGRSGYNSYFVGNSGVQMNANAAINSSAPSPLYSNPSYIYMNNSSDNIPPAESVMQSYTDRERSQSIGHC